MHIVLLHALEQGLNSMLPPELIVLWYMTQGLATPTHKSQGETAETGEGKKCFQHSCHDDSLVIQQLFVFNSKDK